MAWLVGRRRRIRVSGPSMEPTLPDGTTVLVRRGSADVGDVVLFDHPDSGDPIVKRIARLTEDGRLFLIGDGSPSTDSRDFGPVEAAAVRGRVVCTFP